MDVKSAFFNKKRIYVWYKDCSNKPQRIDIEFNTESNAAEVISKIKYMLGVIRRKFLLDKVR